MWYSVTRGEVKRMEPIVVDRKTKQIVSAPTITQGQWDRLWEQYVRSYVRRNPEICEGVERESTADDQAEE